MALLQRHKHKSDKAEQNAGWGGASYLSLLYLLLFQKLYCYIGDFS